MLTRRQALLATTWALAIAARPALSQDKTGLKTVATFSFLADFVKSVGGDRVGVASLVAPNGDAHVYAPTPADARTVGDAKVVFTNGLGFEGWMTRLISASGTKAAVIVTTRGITPLQRAGRNDRDSGHGAADPHAWQSVANAKIYVANIRDALSAADPAGKPVYDSNAGAYLARLDALEAEVKTAIGKIPADRRRIITTHDAFGYFGAAYGMQFIAPQGVSTESEASAQDVAKIITQIRKQKIPAVFMENISDPRLIKRIADETGAKIGGTLFSDALSDDKGPASTYVDMMQNNIRQFSLALMS
jgi:zinc/manganese transport system substrate-binding protein